MFKNVFFKKKGISCSFEKSYHTFIYINQCNKQNDTGKVLPPWMVPTSGPAHGLSGFFSFFCLYLGFSGERQGRSAMLLLRVVTRARSLLAVAVPLLPSGEEAASEARVLVQRS